MIRLEHSNKIVDTRIIIGGSKSESNRWLILQQLYPELGEIQNLSDAKDTDVLRRALNSEISSGLTIDIGHAGTAMRFLTAYFATTPGCHVLLTGSERMQQRPIEPLVTALHTLGCQIKYLNKTGYPPLEIVGKEITKNDVTIRADISSQYITALMLIGAKLPNGLEIKLEGDLTSRPYVEMTKTQLESVGIDVKWKNEGIIIYPKNKLLPQEIIVESDWSSASYWYSIVALSKNAKVHLSSYKRESLQGDAHIRKIYQDNFGVKTDYTDTGITLHKITEFELSHRISLDLNQTPDLAQTIAVTCAGLRIKAELKGLKTLKIKETDRLQALQNELSKLNVSTIITDESLDLISFSAINKTPVITTYDDHRMAMAFAPLAVIQPLIIENPEVVEKSYPKFWKDMETAGFTLQNL